MARLALRTVTGVLGLALAVGTTVACTGHPDATTVRPVPATHAAPIAGADAMTCEGPIDALNRLEPSMHSVSGVVAVDTDHTLQASSSGQSDPRWALFAKTALVVRVGKPFELVIPRAWQSRAAVDWGNDGPRQITDHLQVRGCTPVGAHGKWLVYPGGFWVARPACVPIVVKTATSSRTVHVSVGTRCPTSGD
ncbi:MAG TPA: hypothetical protein VGH85_14460 [Mycobacteriales bacterium]